MTAFKDIADSGEESRIDQIAAEIEKGLVVGFVVDNDENADRYIRKLQLKVKLLEIDHRGPGPVENTVLVRAKKGGMRTHIVVMHKGDPPAFPELADRTMHTCQLDRVAVLQGGMASGRASVFIIVDLPDGSIAAIETSARNVEMIAGAIRGSCQSWGEDNT